MTVSKTATANLEFMAPRVNSLRGNIRGLERKIIRLEDELETAHSGQRIKSSSENESLRIQILYFRRQMGSLRKQLMKEGEVERRASTGFKERLAKVNGNSDGDDIGNVVGFVSSVLSSI
jgi:hypothetical protein